ncbi:YeeE/YedE thiosulfate transporter family protein [Romboutsia sp.]|uniref:YeeE/YedE thiosulfate transporter family protein n=1 Tax=Romboutsia sp. TaxID=1965302 RepID=UPI003F3C6424
MNKNSWIKGAIILGLSFFLAIFLVKPVGVSTQFSVLSGIIHSSIDKNVIVEDSSRESGYISTNEYYDKSEGKLAESIKNPINYDFVFVLAIPFGGYLGYVLKKNRRTDEDEIIKNCSIRNSQKINRNEGFIKKYVPAFLGGFLLLFAARMADGCTSGHMMSGMMQGSISGYVFAAAVFGTAIPTALVVKKLKKSN